MHQRVWKSGAHLCWGLRSRALGGGGRACPHLPASTQQQSKNLDFHRKEKKFCLQFKLFREKKLLFQLRLHIFSVGYFFGLFLFGFQSLGLHSQPQRLHWLKGPLLGVLTSGCRTRREGSALKSWLSDPTEAVPSLPECWSREMSRWIHSAPEMINKQPQRDQHQAAKPAWWGKKRKWKRKIHQPHSSGIWIK